MHLKRSHSLLGQVGLHKNSGNGFMREVLSVKKIKEASDEASFLAQQESRLNCPYEL